MFAYVLFCCFVLRCRNLTYCMFSILFCYPRLPNRISRSDTSLSSDFHFFTSHFYTTLSTEGPGAVRSWTARKKINIFEKRLIFVPINKDLHWSLCVVVNPGSILLTADRSIGKNNNNNNNDDKIDQKPRYTSSDPLPCLIFLDSLRMHNKRKVAKHLHLWLNAEWDRIYPTASSTTPPPPTKIITTTTRTTNDDGSVVKSTAMTTNVTTATTKEEENSRRSSKTELFNLKSLTLFSPTGKWNKTPQNSPPPFDSKNKMNYTFSCLYFDPSSRIYIFFVVLFSRPLPLSLLPFRF